MRGMLPRENCRTLMRYMEKCRKDSEGKGAGGGFGDSVHYMSPNCVDTEHIPSKMVAGDREILGIGENPKSFGESRIKQLNLYGGKNMSTEENKAIARRLIEEVVNKGNLDAIDDLIATDFVWHSAPPGLAPGRESLKQFFPVLHSGLPDWHDTIDDIIADFDAALSKA